VASIGDAPLEMGCDEPSPAPLSVTTEKGLVSTRRCLMC